MHESASKTSRPSGHHPSDVELAAYIDGALGKEEANRVMEHLASCESCFEVYSETLRFQLDESPQKQKEIFQFPRKDPKPAPWTWVAAAAVLVIGFSGGVYRVLLAPPPHLVTAELATRDIAEPLQKGPGLVKGFWVGPTFRGGHGGGTIAVDPASFQIGVQLVNLQVSLEADDADQVSDTIARILQILETQDLVRPLKESYNSLKSQILDSGSPRDFMAEASQLMGETRDYFEAPHLDLGQWVEAGRLSAIAQEPSFFQRGENRSFLRRTLWRQRFGIGDMTIEPAALKSLKDISEVLDQDDLTSADYARLKQSFDRILEIYYPS